MSKWDQYEVQPIVNEEKPVKNWEQYRVENSPRDSFAGKHIPAWSLGLGQFGADTFMGLSEGIGEGEPEFPEQWKHPRLQGQNRERPEVDLSQYADPDDMTQFNIGRYGPAIATLGYTGGKGLKNLAKSYTNKGIGNKIVGDANQLQKNFNERFNGLLDRADDELLRTKPKVKPEKEYEFGPNSDIPLITKESTIKQGQKIIGKDNLASLRKGSDVDTNVKIQDFLDNPNLDTAHWGKSAINDLIRDLSHAKVTRGLSTAEKEAAKAAVKVKKDIQKYMDKQFAEINPEYKKLYDSLIKDYRTEYVPYLKNKNIRQAREQPWHEDFMEPHRLPNELSQKDSDSFMRMMGHKYPELGLNRAIRNPYAWGALGLGGTGIVGAIKGLGGK